jgi:hypothetical protein
MTAPTIHRTHERRHAARPGTLPREALPEERDGAPPRRLSLTILRDGHPLGRPDPFVDLEDAQAEARRLRHGFARGQTSARWSIELRDEDGTLLPIERAPPAP